MIQEIAPKKFDNAYHAKSPKPDDFVLVFRGHGKPDDKILCQIEDGKILPPAVNWGVKSIYYNIYFRLMKPVIFFICRGIYQQVYLYRTFFLFPMNQFGAFAEMTRYTLALPV
ncbi:MAG: hypothetical protein ACLSD6_06535 [Clostridium sp.]